MDNNDNGIAFKEGRTGLNILESSSTRPAAMPPRHLADLDLAGRRAALAQLGSSEADAINISNHYFGGQSWGSSKAREALGAVPEGLSLLPTLLKEVRVSESDDGATRKTLWRLHDGSLVESVLMGYPDRVTLCVSSQAGCGMACPFCATGQAGLTRNLSTAEIVDQVVAMADVTRAGVLTGAPAELTHVVFMGMGEPLANFNRVVEALRRLTEPSPEGLGLRPRDVMVSTVGLVPAMRRLTRADTGVTLAVSLHAPDDQLRDELVPVNRRWPVAEVLGAAWAYADRVELPVWIEYTLIKDMNDQPWRAALLGSLLKGRPAHVNLIALNPTPGSRWDASAPDVERAFLAELHAAGISATVRNTRGREIGAACGQLAAAEKGSAEPGS